MCVYVCAVDSMILKPQGRKEWNGIWYAEVERCLMIERSEEMHPQTSASPLARLPVWPLHLSSRALMCDKCHQLFFWFPLTPFLPTPFHSVPFLAFPVIARDCSVLEVPPADKVCSEWPYSSPYSRHPVSHLQCEWGEMRWVEVKRGEVKVGEVEWREVR